MVTDDHDHDGSDRGHGHTVEDAACAHRKAKGLRRRSFTVIMVMMQQRRSSM